MISLYTSRCRQQRGECETCGGEVQVGFSHCTRCQRLHERATLGDNRAIAQLHQLEHEAAKSPCR